MEFPNIDLVRVFEFDPELLDGLDAPMAVHLRTRMVARRIWLEIGPWQPSFDGEDVRGHLGLLVLDGLLVRTLRLAGRECSEIIGPGDVIRPWSDEDEHGLVECRSEWHVLHPTMLASLDARFATRIARWPTITAALMARSTRRSRALVHQATIAHVRHAETRVLLELWHLADRWGRVTAHGVAVPVPLTHQLLAQLTCLQRPTVSGALSRLVEQGELSRLPEGGWLLHGQPPSMASADTSETWSTVRAESGGRGAARRGYDRHGQRSHRVSYAAPRP